ncbi:ATP-dependent protease [Vibrio qinghaiensis]|uniref:endopeptidase La n=1 Tax=Vibrio qinghaiensis TaxID=2025808 RepID=A0A223MXF6_9VIBR|nr:Lon protease family protein [Vibrio qinghaiensis]ASU22229.1 ATP-dependent protease [Vibrio qinghaiensis]
MTQNIWRSVTPQYDQFHSQLAQYPSLSPVTLLDTQPRLANAIQQFVQLKGFTRVMLINAPDNSIYRQLVSQKLQVIKPNSHVICTESLDMGTIFGQYRAENGLITSEIPGLLDKANGGYLLISANMLLANPKMWPLLKAAVLGEDVSPINCDAKSPHPSPISKKYEVKLIILGDRNQLADVDYLDADVRSSFCFYTELELDLKIDEQSILTYLAYLRWISEEYQLPTLTEDAIPALMTAGARFTEDQHYTPLCVIWHRTLIEEAALESNQYPITKSHIESALDKRYYRESYLQQRALDDILDGQVIIETQGEQVGQVNGLTVIDVAGHPLSYGEPARISCVVHFGDGDITDVERKAELGGNLHAKGMMIMQAFVSSSMNLDAPLPYSASVVFEQSYSEVDGDSASLAELCSLVSALSEHPINQQIAVTGAVDQFGRVQAVGGLNEKIEGFYHVCKHQGFTGGQGVILPRTNLKHLALHKDVVNSIKNDEFHIWPVATVDEAVPILMGASFRGDDEESIINKIAQRIENFERHDQSHSIAERIKNWFV